MLATAQVQTGASTVALDGILERPERTGLWAVPASALLTGADGRACVVDGGGRARSP